MVHLRSAWLAVGLLFAGCYEPFPPTGVPCPGGESSECPGGQICMRNQCRAMGAGMDAMVILDPDGPKPDGSAGDLDGDTIPNASDNCPRADNQDQHDEDKDGVGDVCDNCPHVANLNQANTGEGTMPDAVGDICDPRPNLPGDTIQKFYSFHADPTGMRTLGTWGRVGDDYRYAGGSDGYFLIMGVRDKVVIEAAGVLEQTSDDMFIAVSAGEANNQYHDCGYYDCSGGCGGTQTDFHNAAIERYDGNDWTLLAGNHELAQRLQNAFTIRFSADSVTNRLVCTTIDSRGSATTQVTNANALLPGEVGIRADLSVFRLQYLVVFGQP